MGTNYYFTWARNTIWRAQITISWSRSTVFWSQILFRGHEIQEQNNCSKPATVALESVSVPHTKLELLFFKTIDKAKSAQISKEKLMVYISFCTRLI